MASALSRILTHKLTVIASLVVFCFLLGELSPQVNVTRFRSIRITAQKSLEKVTTSAGSYAAAPLHPIPNDESTLPAFTESSINRTAVVYNPYPDYNSLEWRRRWRGTHQSCRGPRGVVINDNKDDMLMAHPRQIPMPAPMIGAYEETGLDGRFCFDAHARMLPYQYDRDRDIPESSDDEDAKKSMSTPMPGVTGLDWGQLQEECLDRNADRYEPATGSARKKFRMPTDADFDGVDDIPYRGYGQIPNAASQEPTLKKRTAFVIRTYDGNKWPLNMIRWVRSHVAELSLHSGAEYEVIILVEIKDDEQKIFEFGETYRKAMLAAVPAEFRSISVLFNYKLLEAWYPKVGKHEPQYSQIHHMHMPMQLLALLRPDITNFWQTEMDARFSGHHYQFLEAISSWSAAQPRKELWERNSRYYFPAVHGDWESYTAHIANETIGGGVWGPVRTSGIDPIGPKPPIDRPEDDAYSWGVGEDADFLILAPVFNVNHADVPESKFLFGNGKENYPDELSTPAYGAATVPLTRFSQRLLRAMHHGQMKHGYAMMPEMYPESTALHHGLKVVSFPLPVWTDIMDTPQHVESMFNVNAGATMLNHPYDTKLINIWHRMTYWHSMDHETIYSQELYSRWAGVTSFGFHENGEEQLCLPGIYMHPVKWA